MAERHSQDTRYGERARPEARDEASQQPGPHAGAQEEWRGGYGEVSPGEPPRYVGGAPGYGSHGMGYGPQGGTQGGSWGVYGLPHGLASEYASAGRGEPYGRFDEPHGRVPHGWSGSFGSAGEHSARSEAVAARERRAPPGPTQGMQMPHAPARRRGPKFERSDPRIREDICERISDTRGIDAADVMVEVKDGVVTLLGTVPHRAMKHWIEDIAAECSGVKDVENKLRVPLTGRLPVEGGR